MTHALSTASRRGGIASDVMWFTAIVLVLTGAKLLVIGAYGSDLPFWDQWDAEAVNLYLPHAAHGLNGIEWLAPHNDHRILLTRVMALALCLANGQWDAQVQTVANILLHIVCALILYRVVLRFPLNAHFRIALAALVVVGIAAPYGWESTMSGFASCFYFLILVTLLLLCIAAKDRLTSLDCVLASTLG